MALKHKSTGKSCNNFMIILKQSSNGFEKLCRKIREISPPDQRVCYVCLSEPYTDIVEGLKKENLECDNLVFIDALSSPLFALKPVYNCVFVRGMDDLQLLGHTVKKVIKHHECNAVVFDSISALLVYQPSHSIVRFTYDLLTDESSKNAKKVYVSLKEKGVFEEESNKLINDLNLFADSVIELGK